jgi:Family of unknown function (DUF5759)
MSCMILLEDKESVGKLNIDDLYEKRKNRDLKQLSIFNKLLNRIHKRITQTAKIKNNERFIWFQIPEFLFGEACYDNADCCAYLISQLKTNGFTIRYYHPNTLLISWENYVPSYVRSQIKKKTGMIINEKGEVIRGQRNDGGGGDDDDDDGEKKKKQDYDASLFNPKGYLNQPTHPSTNTNDNNKSSNNTTNKASNNKFNPIHSYKSTGAYPTGPYDIEYFNKIGKKLSP